MNTVTFDYETRSELNVRDVGGPKYAKHPSTEVMCAAYKLDDHPTKIWKPLEGEPIPKDLLTYLKDGLVRFEAHNALFEQSITEWVLRRDYLEVPRMSPERWSDSAAKAGACAMPRSLEGLCKALGTTVQKDMAGNRVMLKLSKPRTQWVKERKGDKWHTKQEDFEILYKYCIGDVEGEHAASAMLPELNPFERKVWLANQYMNLNGVQIDMATVDIIIRMINEEFVQVNKECFKLTHGKINSPTERDRVLEWVRARGFPLLENLQAGTVEEALKSVTAKTDCRRLLELRAMVGRASIKKFSAMKKRACEDGRVRDLTLYHGASTGRESGRGLQVQNLAKAPSGFDQDLAIKLINTSDRKMLKLIYGDLFDVFSGVLRSMITATDGNELWSADYNAIEARVLHWICDFQPGLKAWATGSDQYKKMAAVIFNKLIEFITDDERFVGKQAVLGCGFGLGAAKFVVQCAKFGQVVSKELGERTVKKYRETHKPICDSWKNIERAAIKAVLTGKRQHANKTSWWTADGFLWCELPSGRCLAYYGPTVRNEPAPWGELIPKLYHWQTHPKNPKKWVNMATWGGKLVENVVQAIARDLMFHAVLEAQKVDYRYLFSVHDEGNFEKALGLGKEKEFHNLLTKLPPWAEGLPVKVSGWNGKRYRKS